MAADPPQAPTITSITPSDRQLSVRFNPPADDGGAPVLSYEVEINGAAWSEIASSNGTIELSDLENGQSYSLRIRAVNSAGPGEASLEVTGTPGESVVVPPETLSVLVGSSVVLADDNTLGQIEVFLTDNRGQFLTRGGDTVIATTDLGILTWNPSGKTIPMRDNGDGSYSVWLRSADPGDATITIDVNGEHAGEVKIRFNEAELEADIEGPSSISSSKPFEATVTFTEDVTGFDEADVRVTNAVVTSLTGGPQVYSVTIKPAATNQTITVSVPAGVARARNGSGDANTESNTLIVRNRIDQAVIEGFEKVTSEFISRRMDRILDAEPTSYRLDHRRRITSRFGFTANLQNQTGAFGAEILLKWATGERVSGGWALRASDARPSRSLSFTGHALSDDRKWYAWTEGQYSMQRGSKGAQNARDESFGIVFLGFDYLWNDNLTLGFMGHIDRTVELDGSYSRVSGTGWMAGPYLSAELAPNLFFTGRVAWGKSRNSAKIDINRNGTTWNGRFETTRFLARAALYGTYAHGTATISPKVDLAFMRERQADYRAYDDVLVVTVPGSVSRIGRISISAQTDWPLSHTNNEYGFFVNPQIDWDFHAKGHGTRNKRLAGSMEFGIRTGPSLPWQGEAALRYEKSQRKGLMPGHSLSEQMSTFENQNETINQNSNENLNT